jgi:hypothetical protein
MIPQGLIARSRFRMGRPSLRSVAGIPQSEAYRRRSARSKVRYQIKVGKMVRGACEVCGSPNADAHHDDYDKPLAVRWLCQTHHSREHHN